MLLVTGGAGFIGAHLAAAATREGRRVRVLDDLSSGDPARLAPGVELVVADVADTDAVLAACEGVDAVVHLAARRSVPRSVREPLATDRANTAGTLSVLEAAREAGVGVVVCASSSSVYGDPEVLPTPEATRCRPRSPYAVTKLAGEHYAEVYAELHGLRTVSLRFFNVFGPGQPAGPDAQLIPHAVDAYRRGALPRVHGDGSQARDLVFVEDAAAAILAAVDAEDACGPINVGSGRSYTVNAVIEAVAAALGVEARASYGPERAGDVRQTWASVERAARVLAWKAAVSLEEGVARVVAG